MSASAVSLALIKRFVRTLRLHYSVDEDVIKVHYNKNVELLYQDLVDITLKRGRCVGQSKRHDLIFEVTIVGLEGRLPFIVFPDPYLMVDIGQIKPDLVNPMIL